MINRITLGELLHGTDEDFLVNLYLAALGRWPDEMGFAHHLGVIAHGPGKRVGVVHDFMGSEEGRRHGGCIILDPEPVPVEQALAAQLRLRTDVLRAAILELRHAPRTEAATSSVAGDVLALGAALDSLRTEMKERIAALEAALAGQVPASPSLSPRVSLDYVNDLVEASQAQIHQRLRALELRLIEQSAGPKGMGGG